MDHEQLRVLAIILASPDGRAILAAGNPGKVVKLFRNAHEWTQQELADRSGWSQSTISRIEDGKTRAGQDMDVLAALGQALGIPHTALGLASPPDQSRTLDGMDRRHLLVGSIALAVTALLPHAVATAGTISEPDIKKSWAAVRRLQELDGYQGGAFVVQLADGMARRFQDALRRGSYSATVGHELRLLTATAMYRAGWSAFDAGWGQEARRWWLEAAQFADLNELPESRITALAGMALQAGQLAGGGPDAAELAHAALTLGQQNRATPKLLSLLAARQALGYAQAGDPTAARAALGRARTWLDQGEHSNDPFWLGFYGPADLAWHETLIALPLHDGTLAETAARTALAEVDAESYPRNQVLYTVNLGSVLTQLRQYDEAITVTGRAVHAVHTIAGSGRTLTQLRYTIDLLGQQNYPPAKTFATAAHRLLPTAV